MKPINKTLLITGVSIGVFLCTLIVGIVQIRFLINRILTDKDDEPNTYYRIYSQQGEGYTTLPSKAVNRIIKAFPVDILTDFEASSSLPRSEARFKDELITSRILMTGSNYLQVNNLNLLQGRYFNDIDNSNKNKVCVIHERMYQMLGREDNITLNIDGTVFDVIGVVTGDPAGISILNSPYISMDEIIFMPENTYYEYFLHTEPEQNYLIDHVLVKAPNTYTKDYIVSKVSGQASYVFIGSLKVLEEGENEKIELRNTLEIAKNILLVAGMVLLLAVLNIIQITSANLYDIRRQIGLKMAVGATKLDIMKEISLNVITCTLKGGYIGVSLYALLCYTINKYIRDYSALEEILTPMLKQYTGYFRLTFNIETALIGISLSIIIGIISAILPAIKAASIDPIVVLRRE